MKEESRIRLLRADEIECRVSHVSEKGVSLLLYKDARVDQNILDETFGIFGWKREHERIGDDLFCTVSIRDREGEWVAKQDVGKESFAEPSKGAASDSFKRACFNIGIGRELYTAPFLWVPAEKADIRRNKEKLVVKDSFHVSAISYDEKRSISAVEIKNGRGQTVFSMGMEKEKEEKGKQGQEPEKKEPRKMTAVQERKLRKEMERTGVTDKALCERYRISGMKEIDQGIYERAMEALGKTKSIAA